MSSIEAYIHRKAVVLHQTETARQAARAMCERNIGCVIVSDARNDMVGIVTDRDLACAMAMAPLGADSPLSDIMTPRPVSVETSSDIEHVIHVMEECGIRRMPVVERTSSGVHCVGVITLDDLLVSKRVDYDHVARIVRAQIRKKGARHYWNVADEVTESRSSAHQRKSLNQFYGAISSRVSIPPELTAELVHFLVGCLVRRMHYSGAAKFVAELPRSLQDELLALPAGPDREISPETMRRELMLRFGFSESGAAQVIESFYPALAGLISHAELENVLAQLPRDFRSLFLGTELGTDAPEAA